MQKLNICLISLMIPPDSQDGESKFFKGIFDYLKRQGHKVIYLTGKWNYELKDPNIIQVNIIRKRFLWIPQFNLNIIKFLRNNKFDIIHGNGPKGSLPIILSGKKKFISTIHDLGPFEAKSTLLPFGQVLVRSIAKRATYITTCSNAIKKQIKHYIPEVNINKIYNLYSAIEEKFKPYPSEAKKLKEKLNITGPILLYIGRIAFYKGVSDIIKAYYIAKKKISNLNLVIGGKPDYKILKIYEMWKKKYKNVHFIGFVPADKIPIFYSMGDIFITYSYASEGFGLTPIEALACGTPVICSSLPAYKEILQNNAIFVSPRDPQQLAREIISLIKDESKRINMIKNAQNFIKKYNWSYVGKNLEKIYQKLLGER